MQLSSDILLITKHSTPDFVSKFGGKYKLGFSIKVLNVIPGRRGSVQTLPPIEIIGCSIKDTTSEIGGFYEKSKSNLKVFSFF